MTLDRGESPLAGNCSTPLSSVAGLQSLNALGQKSTMGSASTGGLTGESTINTRGSIKLGNSSHQGGITSPQPHHISLHGVTQSPGHIPVSQQAHNGHALASAGHTGNTGQSTSFWLELKGVERWYESLEQSERLALITSLYSRSSEHQLNQFSSAMEKTINGNIRASGSSNSPGPMSSQQPSNLSRFGVGQAGQHNTSQNTNDVNNSYRYRTQLSAGVTQVSSASTNPRGTIGNQLSLPSGPAGSGLNSASFGSSGLTNSGLGGTNINGSGLNGLTGNLSSGLVGIQEPATAPANYMTHRPFGTSSGSSHGSDLYNQAFLPLPRGYSPWGPEIRRPKSASGSGWSDTVTRNSPTSQAAGTVNTSSNSVTGLVGKSPNISSLSLDTPPSSFGQQNPVGSISGCKSQGSISNSPIGHAMKPWRTFKPGQHGTTSGIGQAPDPEHLSVEASPQLQLSRLATGNKSSHSVSGSPESSPPSIRSVLNKEKLAIPMRNGQLDTVLLSDIGAWLRSMRLHKYTGNLSGMKWQDVINLTDKDLEDRGVNALGARRKLLKMFEEIKEAQVAE